MARKSRLESKTRYYHVMTRGNNKNEIFQLAKYKVLYLKFLSEYCDKNDVKIVAYCMMNNHSHLLLKTDIEFLKQTMLEVNTKFATYYNHNKKSSGHVFQGRYKSEVEESDTYFLNVIRYIHNNPLKAKMVKKLSQYSLSSYNEYVGKRVLIDKLQKNFVMSYFKNDVNKFTDFHTITDHNVYLDKNEEMELCRIEYGQEVLTDFCKSRGVTSSKQVYANRELLQELIITLIKNTSMRKKEIAKLIGVSRQTVYRVARVYNVSSKES